MDLKTLNAVKFKFPDIQEAPGNHLNAAYWKIKMEIDFNFKMIDYWAFLHE